MSRVSFPMYKQIKQYWANSLNCWPSDSDLGFSFDGCIIIFLSTNLFIACDYFVDEIFYSDQGSWVLLLIAFFYRKKAYEF